ncbi:hypothetical protein [Hwanghaeella sp. LZ110]|uniref:hypothetical protein n=1 Tax=Hwanghaeella sp. LZ110 TaxID=3402810 RepID=UPI003B66CE74
MTAHKNKTEFNTKTAKQGPPATGGGAMEFDPAEFYHFLGETDWPDDKKAEYITLIWTIVCEFVALGFDVHPVQQARNACGKQPETRTESAFSDDDLLDCSYSDLIGKFVRLSGAEPGAGEKGVMDE